MEANKKGQNPTFKMTCAKLYIYTLLAIRLSERPLTLMSSILLLDQEQKSRVRYALLFFLSKLDILPAILPNHSTPFR